MKSFFYIAILASLLALAVAKPRAVGRSEVADETFEDFEKENHQLFSDPDAEKEAEETLKEEEDEINAQNEAFENGDGNFEEALMPWSDLPTDEFESEKEGLIIPDESEMRGKGLVRTPEWARTISAENQAILDEVYATYDRESLPAAYDAEAEGLVTPARNQKSCGSCAAFAATATHETCLLKAGAKKDGLNLAEQQLVDCAYDPAKGANGCNGAWIGSYQNWMASSGGAVNHEADYPYLDRSPNLKCQNKKTWSPGAKISNAIVDYSCTEDKMKSLVFKYGAVSTAIHASDSSFGNYKSGVYDKCSSKPQDHAVTVVGWGNENGMDYWKVKNSWGSNWGDKGFVKIKMGTCGIGTECALTVCEKSGVAEAAPPMPTPAPIPANLKCDISGLYGPGITGSYNLFTTGSDGKMTTAKVKCTNSVCQPRIAGPSNACVYICGTATC